MPIKKKLINQLIFFLISLFTIIVCDLFKCSFALGSEIINQNDKSSKEPSKHTIALYEKYRKELPFADKRDYEEAKRGFIAAPKFKQVRSDKGHLIWDMESYSFLLNHKQYPSIHPSLQRQAELNMAYGLYEVIPKKIYQVRGFDISNITFIKSKTGWIVFDPLISSEMSKLALNLVNQNLGTFPIKAVIYSHSHGDHFGGIHGIVSEEDVNSGKIQIIAPKGFMEEAISENVYAGNAMNRRLYYQYGILLPRNPYGHVDQAIGKNLSTGTMGLIPPTVSIKKDYETMEIDGVKMIFQNTPGTEAPSEMNTYFPDMKAFWAAENITSTIHNIYTLRGALVRDALKWSKHINDSLYHFGKNSEVMFSSHSWPRWGNERIQEVMRAQRDTYANLNNSVLHLANKGVTINEIHNIYKLPTILQKQWAAHSYHGSEGHNSRAVINRYLGYWDSNPATLIPLSPNESAPLYVEMMGGSEKIIAKAIKLNDEGKYMHSIEILNKLVFAEPNHQRAKELLADVFEQIGYQKESTSLRNSFLAGAYELRHGIPKGNTPKSFGPKMVSAMSTELWLDYIGIRLGLNLPENIHFSINLFTPDNGEKFAIEFSNATLTNIKGFHAEKPDLAVTINRSDLENVMLYKTNLKSLEKERKVKIKGNRKVFEQLISMITEFNSSYEILPGTS
ncbi:alkyl/aryl-sulfatase [Fluviispira sanaruensis]|uniref:Alkyl/aryl-sulfatase n=1 Tax=Fluviispira sanaruensis TaxID=2493639 RepID=A0A4P2VQB9_FLUSA|nr:alkyl sulfatase dimerization domain-containing protein [Fluviispira sanaruensis]BBH54580.1 alkyl/aryl-sulfatase [Fluviispira sanaruensis]